AFINRVETIKSGANLGFINITNGYSSVDISGIGISNSSKAQLGFVNVTKKIEKFQFGFINIAENGFLPVFPIVNFPKK
ncbi:MAG: phaC PHA synthase, partial [Deltaproteobacteria bacterium]|nr:phaC PHA synthase [Deltaproteobacteria bacterium]